MTRPFIVAFMLLSAATVIMAQMVTVDLSENKVQYEDPIELKVTGWLELLLVEYPATGYTWQIYDADMKQNGLETILKYYGFSNKIVETKDSGTHVGGNASKSLEFQVIGPGTGVLNVFYGRPWEIQAKIDAGEDIKSYIYKVIKINVTTN